MGNSKGFCSLDTMILKLVYDMAREKNAKRISINLSTDEYSITDTLLFTNIYTKKQLLNIIKENIKPFIKTHILLSFPPEKLIEIQDYIQKITEIEGIEYEQSSN